MNFVMKEGEDRVKATYGSNYERLEAIKQKYDPTNLFRVNQNIKTCWLTTSEPEELTRSHRPSLGLVSKSIIKEIHYEQQRVIQGILLLRGS